MSLWDALWVFLISAAPIIELRGAIPIAMVTYDFAWYYAFLICFLGNLLPVPLLLLFLNPLAKLLGRISFFNRIISWFFKHTRHRGGLVEKYGWIGLALFVAVPLPSTGAWTGSVLAFLFGIKFKLAFLSILTGVFIAGVIMTALTYLGISFIGSLPE